MPLPSQPAEQLLAEAYTDRRTIEVRIAGAHYAPLRIERNGAGSSFDKPQSLLKAEALIAENLDKSPEDPVWLHAKGQADLLDGNYDEAIKSLQRAQVLQPESTEILIDLGSAHYLRARSTESKADYAYAIDWLGKALAKSPDDPIALFNRGLASEQMFTNTHQAIEDWQHYLRIEPRGEWANEVRRRLAALEERVNQHDRSMATPLLSPTQIARRASDNGLENEIDSRIEEYLHVAITEWLPQAFPLGSTTSNNAATIALSTVSRVLTNRHGDSWLADILNEPKGLEFPAGIQKLSAAVVANDHGDYASAHAFADSAAKLLYNDPNRAAQIRASAEEAYSDQLLYDGTACLALIRALQPRLPNRYPWLQAQMSLEKSNCADLVGDLGTYEAEIDKGMRRAERHKFTALYLRALGFEAQSNASSGDENRVSRAFSAVSGGLSAFWSHDVDLMKGYNLCTDLDTAGDALHLPYFQVVVWREATAIIDRHPDILQRAMARRWYANAAYMADMPSLAEEEFEDAATLLAQAPQTAATTRDYLDAEVWLAELETRKGDANRASSRLEKIEPILARAPSFVPEMRFSVARADIATKQGDSVAAEKALAPAIHLAEWALNSFPAERDRRLWAEETQGVYRNLVEWKLRQGDAVAALELWEWFKGADVRAGTRSSPNLYADLARIRLPDFHQSNLSYSPTEVHDRQASLQDETVVTFAIFPDGLAIWVFDDRGIMSRWITQKEQPLRVQAERFLRLCSNPNTDIAAIRLTGRLLYDSLLAPVASQLDPARTLVIEPDRYLKDIPWEALVSPDGSYLATKTPIVVGSGIYRMAHLRAPLPIRVDTPALVVSVSSAPGLLPLPDADREAQEVAQRFKYARWLQGRNASLSAIQREIGNVGVFHFAGHAISSRVGAGLALGTKDSRANSPQVLGAQELAAGNLAQLDMVVLSACGTGADNQPDGLVSDDLAHTLLGQGVPHVVASRWNVDSAQTTLFMEHLYDRLLNGRNVSSSVRDARLAIASHTASVHPYYWAAFELEGTK